MNHTLKSVLLVLLVLAFALAPLAARPSSVAVGAQLGFAATGVVVDVGLGSMYVQAGLNYPLGITYILANTSDSTSSEDIFVNVYSLNADVSQAFALSDNFDVKLGVGATVFTNFGPVAIGLAGAVVRGEYWIPNKNPNKNTGIFLTMNIPFMGFGVIQNDSTFDGGVIFNPLLPLMGLLTSTVGLLYSF